MLEILFIVALIITIYAYIWDKLEYTDTGIRPQEDYCADGMDWDNNPARFRGPPRDYDNGTQ
jgi:hypothetical protein